MYDCEKRVTHVFRDKTPCMSSLSEVGAPWKEMVRPPIRRILCLNSCDGNIWNCDLFQLVTHCFNGVAASGLRISLAKWRYKLNMRTVAVLVPWIFSLWLATSLCGQHMAGKTCNCLCPDIVGFVGKGKAEVRDSAGGPSGALMTSRPYAEPEHILAHKSCPLTLCRRHTARWLW